ncbi:MAG: LPXTG cell wall anchor domain-containing protein, partial [Ruminococcaceae bacterium]|nr:LPXTG cell wall anchor domain-containing protein [Oscillospiraceae bacterium]
ALNDAIAEAEALNRDLYTAESLAKVDEALEEAKAALTSNDQAVVDAAAKKLNDAIDALELKPVVPPAGDTMIGLYIILALCVLVGGAVLVFSKKRKAKI